MSPAGQEILPLQSELMMPYLECGAQFWSSAPSQERFRHMEESSVESARWWMDQNISHMRKGWQKWHSFTWKGGGLGGSYQCAWILKENANMTEPSSLQWCPVPGKEAMGTNGNAESSLNNRKYFYCAGEGALSQAAQRSCGVSSLEILRS